MKKYIFTIIFCLIPFIGFAQVRSKVCIVRPNYSDNVVEMINDFIPRLERMGVENPQQYIDDFLTKGISGSGFVYVAPDGKNYVITNRHVISDAATSTVIFEDEKTKTQKSISGMKIFASDAALDLAVLEFPPEEQPFSSGFDFYTEDVFDGDSVYTAGYPGLMGKSVWQFGTGIITNTSVEVEEMIKPELSSLIQHSAQIDGGNSGGPLLVKTTEGEYKVIGVNTWKLTNRQDTNFAIPAATVENFINKVLSGEKTASLDSQSVIIENATNLHKSLNKYNVTFEELVNYISIDFVANEGKTIFDKVINLCTTENRKTINMILENYSPIESVRYAIGWYIFNEYHKDEYVTDQSKKSSVKETKLPQLEPPVQIEGTDYWNTSLYNGATRKNFIVTWTYVNGGWEILTVGNKNITKEEYETKKNKSRKKEPVPIPEGKADYLGTATLYMPFDVQISYGKNLWSKQNPRILWSNTLDAKYTIKNYLSALIEFELMEESVHIYSIGEKAQNIRFIDSYAGAQAQLPLIKQHVLIMPYLSLQGGAELSDFGNINAEFVGKVKLGTAFYFFVAHNNLGLFVDANLNAKLHTKDFSKKDVALNLSAGIAF